MEVVFPATAAPAPRRAPRRAPWDPQGSRSG